MEKGDSNHISLLHDKAKAMHQAIDRQHQSLDKLLEMKKELQQRIKDKEAVLQKQPDFRAHIQREAQMRAEVMAKEHKFMMLERKIASKIALLNKVSEKQNNNLRLIENKKREAIRHAEHHSRAVDAKIKRLNEVRSIIDKSKAELEAKEALLKEQEVHLNQRTATGNVEIERLKTQLLLDREEVLKIKASYRQKHVELDRGLAQLKHLEQKERDLAAREEMLERANLAETEEFKQDLNIELTRIKEQYRSYKRELERLLIEKKQKMEEYIEAKKEEKLLALDTARDQLQTTLDDMRRQVRQELKDEVALIEEKRKKLDEYEQRIRDAADKDYTEKRTRIEHAKKDLHTYKTTVVSDLKQQIRMHEKRLDEVNKEIAKMVKQKDRLSDQIEREMLKAQKSYDRKQEMIKNHVGHIESQLKKKVDKLTQSYTTHIEDVKKGFDQAQELSAKEILKRRDELLQLAAEKNAQLYATAHVARTKEQELIQKEINLQNLRTMLSSQQNEIQAAMSLLKKTTETSEERINSLKQEAGQLHVGMMPDLEAIGRFKEQDFPIIQTLQKDLDLLQERQKGITDAYELMMKKRDKLRDAEQKYIETLEKEEQAQKVLKKMHTKILAEDKDLHELRDTVAMQEKMMRREFETISKAKDLKEKLPKLKKTYNAIITSMKKLEVEAMAKYAILKDKEQDIINKQIQLQEKEESLVLIADKIRDEQQLLDTKENAFNKLKEEGIIATSGAIVPETDSEHNVRLLLDKVRSCLQKRDFSMAKRTLGQAERSFAKLNSDNEELNFEILELRTDLKLSSL